MQKGVPSPAWRKGLLEKGKGRFSRWSEERREHDGPIGGRRMGRLGEGGLTLLGVNRDTLLGVEYRDTSEGRLRRFSRHFVS